MHLLLYSSFTFALFFGIPQIPLYPLFLSNTIHSLSLPLSPQLLGSPVGVLFVKYYNL